MSGDQYDDEEYGDEEYDDEEYGDEEYGDEKYRKMETVKRHTIFVYAPSIGLTVTTRLDSTYRTKRYRQIRTPSISVSRSIWNVLVILQNQVRIYNECYPFTLREVFIGHLRSRPLVDFQFASDLSVNS